MSEGLGRPLSCYAATPASLAGCVLRGTPLVAIPLASSLVQPPSCRAPCPLQGTHTTLQGASKRGPVASRPSAGSSPALACVAPRGHHQRGLLEWDFENVGLRASSWGLWGARELVWERGQQHQRPSPRQAPLGGP